MNNKRIIDSLSRICSDKGYRLVCGARHEALAPVGMADGAETKLGRGAEPRPREILYRIATHGQDSDAHAQRHGRNV